MILPIPLCPKIDSSIVLLFLCRHSAVDSYSKGFVFDAGMNLANMSKCLKCAGNDDIITLKVMSIPGCSAADKCYVMSQKMQGPLRMEWWIQGVHAFGCRLKTQVTQSLSCSSHQPRSGTATLS
jgi:hypothetical protein